MFDKKLRFRARGLALVQNFEKLDRGIKTFLGWRYHQDSADGHWKFSHTDEVAEVAYAHEYVKACRDGDLWAADAETAALCGVEFDPTFGAAPAPAAPAPAPAEPEPAQTALAFSAPEPALDPGPAA